MKGRSWSCFLKASRKASGVIDSRHFASCVVCDVGVIAPRDLLDRFVVYAFLDTVTQWKIASDLQAVYSVLIAPVPTPITFIIESGQGDLGCPYFVAL